MKSFFRRVNGILLLDKPAGMTSNGALQRVRRLFEARKAGHTGSLDPLATGMLPLCFGEATRVSQFLLEADKQYAVTGIPGIRTTTADASGEVTDTRPVPLLTETLLQEVLSRFMGTISQVPPMFSAIKHQGKPLYRLARQGISVERKPRQVRIDRLTLQGVSQSSFDIEIHCSKGTYVRTLIEDIGEALGCGAHVGALRRLGVGPWRSAAEMVTMAQLEALRADAGPCSLQQLLLPLDSPLAHLPAVRLSAAAAFYLKGGQSVLVPGVPSPGFVRLYDGNGCFMGIGEVMDDGRVFPRRLIVPGAVPATS